MPPLILWAAGIIGAAIAGRFVYREARRVNAVLHPEQRADEPPVRTLERDPSTGVYRDRSSR
jgi:hypothetical protein